jgi:predicted acylesterase/phospholipase RssA
VKRRTRDEHLFGPGPKRILALDGGGIRGVLTLEYLQYMEDILRRRAGDDPTFRLCDYFDLIGGTSTGSIIAAGLALGFSVERLRRLYRDLASTVFQRPFYRLGFIASKFPRAPLERALRDQMGDVTVGSDAVRTGLMIMTKRLDTGSPWPIHNNPRGRYYARRTGGTGLANSEFLLRQVVRASTAAPHYFEPERLRVARASVSPPAGRPATGFIDGAFVDGGVSPFNNPALQLLLLATLGGYGLRWPLGTDKLLLVSVGTGYRELRLTADEVMEMPASVLALRSLASLMSDCDWLGQTMLQWLSSTPTPWLIDREIGDLRGDALNGRELLTYIRYNVMLDSAWLKQHLGLDVDERTAASLHAMDNPANVEQLVAIGAAAARVQIKDEHFPATFDPTE